MGRKLTPVEYTAAARKIHGEDTYCYDKTIYTGNAGIIIIGCKIHGDFTQVASEHTRGRGCNQCSKENKRDSSDTVIEQFRSVHDDIYDYSLAKYVNNKTKIIVGCRNHGAFQVTPSNHKNGTGCPKCRNRNTGDRLRLTLDEFVEKARAIHGNLYQYGNDYASYNDKVTIVCSRHGDFKQLVKNHLDGSGCPQCGNMSIGEKNLIHQTLKYENHIPTIKEKVVKIRYGKDQFVSHANKVHDNKYIYNKVGYVNNHTNVVIGCPHHGDFEQDPGTHLKGHGCPKCGIEKRSLKSKENIFAVRGKEIFEDAYDYSKTEYKNWDTPAIIICPKHGEFKKSYKEHIIRKKGCKLCEGSIDDTRSFIHKAKVIHGDTYDYDKTVYSGSGNKVIITCRNHGDFSMEPFNHTTNKQGCPKCRNEKFSQEYRNDLETFLRKSIERHGYFYDYSKVNYISNKTDVEIICPTHGSFWQGAGNHYSGGQGCPKCGLIKIGNSRRDTRESFIEKAKLKHGDRYDFSDVVYINCNTEVKIICSIHGEFWQKPMFTVRGCGCQSCAKTESKWEGELKEYVRSLGITADKNKSLINPWELDIYIAENKLAIEANGLWWHSEYNDTISSTYHLNKTEMCNDLGIQLLHIFEDEWHDKKDIVKSMVSHKLGKTSTKLAARKCEIRDVSNDDARAFLILNHVQGPLDNLDVNLGLYFAGELVSIMCLGKPRYDTDHQYEIYRLCSKTFVSVIGSAGKLLTHFIIKYNPDSIVSYANKRFSKGGVYENIGMTYLGDTKNMNYWYVHKDRLARQGRTAFQKHILKDKLKKYDETLTEIENMKMNNYYRIWDCGQMIYGWTRPE